MTMKKPRAGNTGQSDSQTQMRHDHIDTERRVQLRREYFSFLCALANQIERGDQRKIDYLADGAADIVLRMIAREPEGVAK